MSDLLLEAQLELAIHDIGQRQLYADMLCERGDPRGEFIHLQLLSEPTAEQEERANQLLREYRLTWLGSLAAFVELDDRPGDAFGVYWHQGGEIRLGFSQGFLNSCPLKRDLSKEQTREALAHPLMTTVEVLRLFGSDCFGLGRLQKLSRLHLVDQCPELSEVCKLSQLKQLRLFYASELEPLTRMPALTHLDLDLNREVPVDLAPLASLHQLEVLDVSEMPDLSLISRLTNLRSLNTEVSSHCDLSPLLGLSKLESLTLYRTKITDLSPLADLTNLATLVLDDVDFSNKISGPHDVSHLWKLNKLEELSLGEVSDLSAIKNMPLLRELTIYGTECSDLSPVASCGMLEELSVYNSSVTSLDPLGCLKRLKALSIGQSPITDLSPLGDLLALEKLDIHQSNVADLSPLSGLARLRKLCIDETPVRDLSPLSTLCNLDELSCNRSNVSGQSIQGLQQALPYLEDDDWPSRYIVESFEETAQRIFQTPAHREYGEDILFSCNTLESGITRLYVYLDVVSEDPVLGHEIARDQLWRLRPEDWEDESVKLEIYYLLDDKDLAQDRSEDYEILLGVDSVYERRLGLFFQRAVLTSSPGGIAVLSNQILI